MKKIVLICILLLSFLPLWSQEWTGEWTGNIELNGQELGFVFHIEKNGDSYSTTMDIPLQGLQAYPADHTSIKDGQIQIRFYQLKIDYEGQYSDGIINGALSQSGFSLPLNLKKGGISLNRPQTPQEPFNYDIEEVTFMSHDNLKLKGVLSIPRGVKKYPLLIIISGSGPQDRNGTLFGHHLYWVMADYFTRQGIAVLRYDERGVGESEGNFDTATVEMMTQDVESAVKYIQSRKDLKVSQLGLLGHSLGGIIAPQVAVKYNKDIDFIVLMAAAGQNGDQVMLEQKAAFERGLGIDEDKVQMGQEMMKSGYDLIKSRQDIGDDLTQALREHYLSTYPLLISPEAADQIAQQLSSPEIVGLVRYQPELVLSKIKCPVLALNGEKDFQVVAASNLKGIENILQKNGHKKYKIMSFKNLNHLFQEAETGLLNEYGNIEQTISPEVLEVISQWIKNKYK